MDTNRWRLNLYRNSDDMEPYHSELHLPGVELLVAIQLAISPDQDADRIELVKEPDAG